MCLISYRSLVTVFCHKPIFTVFLTKYANTQICHLLLSYKTKDVFFSARQLQLCFLISGRLLKELANLLQYWEIMTLLGSAKITQPQLCYKLPLM